DAHVEIAASRQWPLGQRLRASRGLTRRCLTRSRAWGIAGGRVHRWRGGRGRGTGKTGAPWPGDRGPGAEYDWAEPEPGARAGHEREREGIFNPPAPNRMARASGDDAPAVVADIERLAVRLADVRESIGRVIFGQADVVAHSLITLMGGGHALLIG